MFNVSDLYNFAGNATVVDDETGEMLIFVFGLSLIMLIPHCVCLPLIQLWSDPKSVGIGTIYTQLKAEQDAKYAKEKSS